MSTFKLPDLGEGLAEAEILKWHVKVGDRVQVDQPMVSVETAKAVVEVPAPYGGIVTALCGQPGDIVLLAGKGHETYQVLRDRTIDYDDREEARRVLRGMGHRG